jgi:DNA-binding CsgD family transcriptional regulator
MLCPEQIEASLSEQGRDGLRERIGVALSLAIGNSPAEAGRALANVKPTLKWADEEMSALYFQALAVTHIKARSTDQGFKTFQLALEAAQKYGDAALRVKVLINYGTASVQDGNVDLAIELIEEALKAQRSLGSSSCIALLSLGEALLAAGQLQRAARTLHEFHAIQRSGSVLMDGTKSAEAFPAAAAVGIPVGTMLPDEMLLKLSSEPVLLDLAFARREDWVLGPLVEAFCALYEREGQQKDHDALLARGIDSLSSLDNSLELGIRVARVGPAHQLSRMITLMSRQCAGTSPLLRAHKDVFDSFIASRRRLKGVARNLGLRAAREFARVRRPFLQALALEAAGFPAEAKDLRMQCGARGQLGQPKWVGTTLGERLAPQLTPREWEVARLVARGSTNRTIALTLGCSERTIQCHCASVFGKLGIRSRWQLSNAIGGILKSDCG